MKRLLALIYGVLTYALFFGTFLYTIAFIAGIGVPKTIDNGVATSPIQAAILDALLLSLFAVQHSGMARRGFKRQWTKVVSWYVERTTYVLVATLTLILLVWQWRPIPRVVWQVSGRGPGLALDALFWAGWATLLTSTFLIDHFELFGLAQVWAYFRGREFHRPAFRTPSLYRMVRHPIYLGFVIGFWATPRMTMGHLLFSVAATGYLFVGILFEERDLIAAYGNAYLEYRRRVPMLIPFLKRPPAEHKKKVTTAT